MEPEIGRIVHYQSYGTPNGEFEPKPRPAIITEVHDDNKVSATVFQPQGMYFNELPFSEEPKPGHWSWPPHLRG